MILQQHLLKGPKRRFIVFISHSGEDDFIRNLKIELDQYHETIISEWNSQAGGELREKIKSQILSADILVAILTPQAVISPWVNQEMGFAIAINLPIIPVRMGDISLPGFLSGKEYVSRFEGEAETREAVLRITQSVNNRLIEKFGRREFDTYTEYREWWTGFDETEWTKEKCYWATPHDTWSWIMIHNDSQYEARYRTLIRGSYEFDKKTVESLYHDEEVVYGVSELHPYREVAVFGDLSVETTWQPEFYDKIDNILRNLPADSMEGLFRWYLSAGLERTKTIVRLYIDSQRASDHRRELDYLYEKHRPIHIPH